MKAIRRRWQCNAVVCYTLSRGCLRALSIMGRKLPGYPTSRIRSIELFSTFLHQICILIRRFLSFVAPTTVSIEMTWNFLEFRMKHLSANGEECACKLGRGGVTSTCRPTNMWRPRSEYHYECSSHFIIKL